MLTLPTSNGMKLTSLHYFIFFVVIAIGGIIAARIWGETQPGKYDEFAQCINDSGAKFYGAFWCPHCEDQKDMFGNSQRLLPYVECSTPDRQNRTQVCIEADIQSYPTWDLKDGTRINGVQTMQKLAEVTECTLTES